MNKAENAVAIVDRLLSLGEEFATACRIANVSEKTYREVKGGKAMRTFRLSKGLTQIEVGKAIGVPTSSIAMYESGEKYPTEKVLDKIRDVYGVDVAAVTTAPQAKVRFVIQSPLGGEITYDEVLSRVGDVDKVYVRVDQNKAYWVRGEENGSIDLW